VSEQRELTDPTGRITITRLPADPHLLVVDDSQLASRHRRLDEARQAALTQSPARDCASLARFPTPSSEAGFGAASDRSMMSRPTPQPIIRPVASDLEGDGLCDGLGSGELGDLAPATLAAYRSDWRAFTSWCHAHGHQPLPAAPESVVAWLTHQAPAGYAAATLQRRLATISRTHRRHGHPVPTDHPAVTTTWLRLRRELGVAQRKVAPITLELLRTLIATCPSTAAGDRDHALLVIGFAGALRRSELAQLRRGDIEHTPAGLIVTIRRSKGDQHGAGQRLGLPNGSHHDTCPTRALTAWTRHLPTDGHALFRAVDRHGNIANRHLTGRAIAELIKRRVATAGLDPDRYSGHSLRAGFATSAAAAGATEIAIARQTRHRSMDVLRGYIREGDLFRTNAATTLGL
jgi:site-specific recombinase XerD